MRELRPPWSGDGELPTISDVAIKLMQESVAKEINAWQFDPNLLDSRFYKDPTEAKEMGYTSLYREEDPHMTSYAFLIERTERQFQNFLEREDVLSQGSNAKLWEKYNRMGIEMIQAIILLRKEATQRYLHGLLILNGERDGIKGLGIPLQYVGHKRRRSGVRGGQDYPIMNFSSIFQQAWKDKNVRPKLQAKNFKSVDQLVVWATNLGNPHVFVPLEYNRREFHYWRAVQTWKWALEKAKANADSLSSLMDKMNLGEGSSSALSPDEEWPPMNRMNLVEEGPSSPPTPDKDWDEDSS
ncbi:hypothetical protein CTA1_873 [Colletotrichum tanaceti]|uniref:Uncharacterized protein n=1 Tax=Colletotrichum tanaceti TaxID=1306861 RepID=A0A4U6XT71_9PEZI|nr:hypothetical protein CTA1_873 [Colletotrichum tanaceti]